MLSNKTGRPTSQNNYGEGGSGFGKTSIQVQLRARTKHGPQDYEARDKPVDSDFTVLVTVDATTSASHL